MGQHYIGITVPERCLVICPWSMHGVIHDVLFDRRIYSRKLKKKKSKETSPGLRSIKLSDLHTLIGHI